MAPDAHHHDSEDDHRHDLGLAYDLDTMGIDAAALEATPVDATPPGSVPRSLDRRRALKVLAGAAGGLALAACSKASKASAVKSGASTTTSTTGVTSSTSSSTSSTIAAATTSTTKKAAASSTAASPAAATTTTTAPTTASATQAIPTETAGPFPGDGSNGPNVLVQSGIVRSDIRSSFGSMSGTAAGVPLQLALTIVSAATGKPITGAAVYLWHCDRNGGYSLYSQGVTNQNYLRGIQAAGADGKVAFTTIFPAAYRGRYPHIHFEIYPSLAAATSAGSRLTTTQLALPAAACDTVYASSGYEQSKVNYPQTPINRDLVFSDGYALQVATVTGSASAMSGTLTVAV